MLVRRSLAVIGLAAAALTATPAFAGEEQDHYGQHALPPIPNGPQDFDGPVAAYSVEERKAWLAECRDRMSVRDDGVEAAIIGGVIGGVAGNRIAGRGNRVAGTVIGAGVGAVAGAAIDRAEDRGDTRDFCEDYLDRYENSYAGGYGRAYGEPGHGFGHGMKHHGAYGYPYYGGRVMWVPVKISGGCQPKCDCTKEHMVEEWIEEPVPARRVVPTKRVPITPTKYTKTKYVK